MPGIPVTQPVVILGDEPRVVVTIARSLHQRHIPVIVVGLSAEEGKPVSRAIRYVVHLPHRREDPDKFLAELSRLIRSERCSMVIPSNDTGLTVATDHYEALSALLHVGCPPPAIVRQVLNKDQTLRIAQKCGIAIPTTYAVYERAHCEALRGDMRFPIVAKPCSKTDIAHSTFKVRYVESFEELSGAFAVDEQFGSRNLLQEYCPGEGVGLGVLIKQGEPVAMFQHRRLTELPYTGGVSVTAVSEALDPLLADQAITLLRALHWDGVAMVEFRQDSASGRAVLMEVNGRYWGSISLAVQAGMDFPLYDWQLAHGMVPTVPSQYAIGMKWRWTTGDLMRLHGLLLDEGHNHVSRPSRWKEAGRFLLDSRLSTRSALWSIADPQPAISEMFRILTRLALTDVKQLISSVIPPNTRKAIRFYRNLDPHVRAVYLRQQLLRNLGWQRACRRRIPDGIHSIMFICHGNIIRSPMAQALLQRYLTEAGLKDFTVSSGGLHTKTGSAADRRALLVAQEFGISLDAHKATQLTCASVRRVDVIFVMDYLNEARLLNCCPEVKSKTFFLGAYLRDPGFRSMEISDPYHGTEADIRQCYQTLDRCVASLWKELSVRACRTRENVR
ncbi:MAG: ATP-grasp domain-containing protein [Nitrospiraceae bacterium]|nr:ATP-grasp domain-containing protein [Nitrospiraceae bacterium]